MNQRFIHFCLSLIIFWSAVTAAPNEVFAAQSNRQELQQHTKKTPQFLAQKKLAPGSQEDECSCTGKTHCPHQANCCHYLLIIDHQLPSLNVSTHSVRNKQFEDNFLILKEFPREPFRPPV